MISETSCKTKTEVDVEDEIAYWRSVYSRDPTFKESKFTAYACLLRLGYAILQSYPRASEEQRFKMFREAYAMVAATVKVPWDHARWIVHHSWRHLESQQTRASRRYISLSHATGFKQALHEGKSASTSRGR